MSDLIIGSHVGFKKDTQLLGSVKEALSYGSNAFMIYTGAPQNTVRSPIDNNLTHLGLNLMIENKIDINNVIVHAPYIVNLASNNDFAIQFLKTEIKRTKDLGLKYIVLHPGSYVSLTKEEGIKNIIDGLNKVLEQDIGVYICLETMAGKGTEIGTNFDDIKKIIDGVKLNEFVMVCMDTCHLNDSGYNISNFDEVLKEFDKTIGLKKLACIHINDSKNEIGAKRDRHENFGFGNVGFESLIKIIYHPLLTKVPKILETPYVTVSDNTKEKIYPPYKLEIEMIKNKKMNHNLIEDIRNHYKKL